MKNSMFIERINREYECKAILKMWDFSVSEVIAGRYLAFFNLSPVSWSFMLQKSESDGSGELIARTVWPKDQEIHLENSYSEFPLRHFYFY